MGARRDGKRLRIFNDDRPLTAETGAGENPACVAGRPERGQLRDALSQCPVADGLLASELSFGSFE